MKTNIAVVHRPLQLILNRSCVDIVGQLNSHFVTSLYSKQKLEQKNRLPAKNHQAMTNLLNSLTGNIKSRRDRGVTDLITINKWGGGAMQES